MLQHAVPKYSLTDVHVFNCLAAYLIELITLRLVVLKYKIPHIQFFNVIYNNRVMGANIVEIIK